MWRRFRRKVNNTSKCPQSTSKRTYNKKRWQHLQIHSKNSWRKYKSYPRKTHMPKALTHPLSWNKSRKNNKRSVSLSTNQFRPLTHSNRQVLREYTLFCCKKARKPLITLAHPEDALVICLTQVFLNYA